MHKIYRSVLTANLYLHFCPKATSVGQWWYFMGSAVLVGVMAALAWKD
jgi:hypothetical protein